MPMPIKAVFFDLGETLIDERRMWREWADYLGVTEAEFLAALEGAIVRGEHHHRAFETIRPGFDPRAAWRARIADGTSYSFRPDDLYPDAAECLSSLRKRGYFIGIAGNQSRDLLDSMLTLGLDADLITTSDHLGFDKPSPKFFEALLSHTGFRPEDAAYVGDRVDNDILPAQAAGMTGVFIERGPWGRIHAKSGDAARADICVHALSELAKTLAP
jgi:HAD superfamily hydrolase (TIGR01549 family)